MLYFSVDGEFVPKEGDEVTYKKFLIPPKMEKHQAVQWGRYGNEKQTLMAMRSRLMAYSKGLPSGKRLRQRMSQIVSINEIDLMAEEHINYNKFKSENLTVV